MNNDNIFTQTGTPGNREFRIVFEKMPASPDEMKMLPAADLTVPAFTAALTAAALAVYPADKDASAAMLNWLKGPQPLTQYEIQFLSDRFRGKEYIAASFFEGASPKNNYTPDLPFSIKVFETPHSSAQAEEGYMQLYLKSSGADSLRPVKLRLKASTGEWFLWEQMLLSDIRIPESSDPWA